MPFKLVYVLNYCHLTFHRLNDISGKTIRNLRSIVKIIWLCWFVMTLQDSSHLLIKYCKRFFLSSLVRDRKVNEVFMSTYLSALSIYCNCSINHQCFQLKKTFAHYYRLNVIERKKEKNNNWMQANTVNVAENENASYKLWLTRPNGNRQWSNWYARLPEECDVSQNVIDTETKEERSFNWHQH